MASAGIVSAAGGGVSSLLEAGMTAVDLAKTGASLAGHEQAEQGLQLGSSLVDVGRAAPGGMSSFESAMSGATTAGTGAAAGALAIVGGTIDLTRGVYGAVVHGKRQKKLEEAAQKHEERAKSLVQEQQADPSKGISGEQIKEQENLALSSQIAGSTQKLNKHGSIATAAKGAAMIVGGSLLIAAAAGLAGAGPVGWAILGVAAAVGGVIAAYKWWKKRKRKKETVDKVLGLEAYLEKQDTFRKAPKKEQERIREQSRDKLMQAKGYSSVDECYTGILTELSTEAYQKGIEGDNKEYEELIINMGLKIDKKKKTPKPELIAKKMHA
jgi:hypothetical protein